jgi:transcriptional regulator with PAS, ATPase and Fis domain
VALNCTALPDNLLESELFGFTAGAFTGATKSKQGLMALADGGTLFLDEIAEISEKAQLKLLRFLQERAFTPLGATEPLSVNLRIITATNRELEKRVEEGAFRQDLYFRLNVVPIHLPPLRERREDIPVLAAHFVERCGKDVRAAAKGLSVDAMIMLSCYPWPGNVRELENTIERMIVLHPGKELLDVEDVPEEIRKGAEGKGERGAGGEDPILFKDAQGAFEREYLTRLFKETKGNISEAAKLSGISRSQLHYKIKKLGIDPAGYRW